MANTIILKRSSTPSKVPSTAQLALGEVAINTFDGRMFIKKDDGTPAVVEIGGVTSVNSQGGDVVLTTTEINEGSNQYFTQARARSALSAGTGISYNSATGAISTAQNLSTAGSPTFASATLTGNLTVKNIVPSDSNVYDLGTEANPWRHVYVGPGSLYVNGKQVLTENSGTMTFTADLDQNIRLTTTGLGILQLGSSSTNVSIDGTLQIAAGKRITSSDGVKVQFGDDVEMNNNKVIGLGTPTATTDAATKGYVDTSIAAISTSSITQGNSSVQVVDSGTGTVTVTVDGSTALTVDATGVTVAGNMTINGTTTSVNSNTISLADNIITLNSDATGAPTQNAGMEVQRGDENKVSVRWNEGLDVWQFTNDGAVYTQIATSTDTLAEGTSNLFHTAGRARTALSASSSSGITYNSASGAFSLGGIPNTSLANSQVTINGSTVVLGGATTISTTDISEGTNQYFTTGRARASISVTGAATFNNSTGVINVTGGVTSVNTKTGAVTLSTSDVAEGTNLYYTDARAVSANASAVSAAITTAAADATAKVSAEASARATAVSAAITTAAADATAKVSAEATARDAAITAAIATKDNTDEIAEGSSNLYFTTARARSSVSAGVGVSYNSSTGVISSTGVTGLNGITGSVTLSNFHSSVQTVTSGQATSNVSGTVSYTFSDLSGAVHYNVYLNRMLLRPSEVTVSGTTVTIAVGTLATDDEIEVVGCKAA